MKRKRTIRARAISWALVWAAVGAIVALVGLGINALDAYNNAKSLSITATTSYRMTMDTPPAAGTGDIFQTDKWIPCKGTAYYGYNLTQGKPSIAGGESCGYAVYYKNEKDHEAYIACKMYPRYNGTLYGLYPMNYAKATGQNTIIISVYKISGKQFPSTLIMDFAVSIL